MADTSPTPRLTTTTTVTPTTPTTPTPTTTPTVTPEPKTPTEFILNKLTMVTNTNIGRVIIFLMYIGLFYLYFQTFEKYINTDLYGSIDGTPESRIYLISSIIMIFLFFLYKVIKVTIEGTTSLFNVDDFIFIIGMAIYFSISIGISINTTHSFYALISLAGLIAILVVGNFLRRFLTLSYPLFFFIIIIVGLVLLITFSNKFNIPNSGTWKIWAMAASLIFGFKYFFFNKFSTQNPIVITLFLFVVSVITYLMIIPTEISQITLTVFFSIACLFFSIIVPTDIPYLNFGILAIAIIASAFFGLKDSNINMTTIQVFFMICGLYLSISFSDKISKGPPSWYTLLFLYVIIWLVITAFYFTSNWNIDFKKILNTVYIPLSCLLLATLSLFGIGVYNNNVNQSHPFSESSMVGIFITLVGILLGTYYIANKETGSSATYPIIYFIVFFLISNIILMITYMKGLLVWILFALIITFQILSIWFFESASEKNSLYWIGFSISILLWILCTFFFWKDSKITISSIFNVTSINFMIFGLMMYFIIYYLQLVIKTKQNISQKFSQIMLIIILSYLLLQIFKTTTIAKHPVISFIIAALELIPCYYEDTISSLVGIKKESGEDFTNHPLGIKIILFVVFAIILYTFYPYLKNWLITVTHTPGVSLIGNTPMSTNSTNLVKTYEELTDNPEDPLYNYGISFYINIIPTSGPDEYFTIIDFTGNLFVKYNVSQNQLYVYSLNESDQEVPLYRYNQFPLQKWVKMEINYVGGIYDVFVDNVIKTSNNVVSYNTHSNVYVGEEGSVVIGKVKEFMFYKKPLNLRQIQKTK